MGGVGQQELRARILQQLGHLLGIERGIKGNGDDDRGENAEIHRHPAWAVTSKDCAASATVDARRFQPCGDGVRHLPGAGKSVGFQIAVLALHLERDMRRELLNCLQKPRVEIGHVSSEDHT